MTRDGRHPGASAIKLARRPAREEELVADISLQRATLERLEKEQADARARLAGLQAELASLGSEPKTRVDLPPDGGTRAPRTPAEKVELFRSLFRGREDIFPTRFVAKKTGKPGYAPACRNKFVKGVCEVPKVGVSRAAVSQALKRVRLGRWR